MHQFPGLDHLRAVAISLVFVYHYMMFSHPAWMEGIFHFGWAGVDLFFAQSGFLISNQLFAELEKTATIRLSFFYVKRAFRILPPYLFVLLIYIFIQAFHEREALPPVWKFLSFTQNFGLDIRDYGTFSHAWSLCVEEQFYLVFPVILLLVFYLNRRRNTGWLIPVMFCLPLILRWAIWHFYLVSLKDPDLFGLNWYRWIYYPTFSRLDGLIAGIGVAAIFRFRPQWLSPFRKSANWITGCFFALLTISFFADGATHSAFSTIVGFSLVALLCGLLVLSAVLPESFLSRFKFFATRHLATLSYSLYLCHKGLIHLTQRALSHTSIPEDGLWMFFICLLICIAGATLMHLLIEKPALYARDAVIRRMEFYRKSPPLKN